MKYLKCRNCGISEGGTQRKKFCSAKCRAEHWRKEKLKNKKPQSLSTEELQNRAISSTFTLGERAVEGDMLAIQTLEQVEKILKMTEAKLINEKEKRRADNTPKQRS